jgi:hypothetical protein
MRGRVVPFLGAGVNLSNREDRSPTSWKLPADSLPSGPELARYLAEQFHYPVPQDCEIPDCPIRPPAAAALTVAQKPHEDCLYRQADLDLARGFSVRCDAAWAWPVVRSVERRVRSVL